MLSSHTTAFHHLWQRQESQEPPFLYSPPKMHFFLMVCIFLTCSVVTSTHLSPRPEANSRGSDTEGRERAGAERLPSPALRNPLLYPEAHGEGRW